MTKVVVNAKFGGFGLSPAAERAYLARKGKQAFFFTDARDANGRIAYGGPKVPLADPDDDSLLMRYTSTSPEPSDETWWYDRDVPRDDPDLVAVVEELGAAASGRHADLRVVEVPDDAQWEISEYDGLEHVAEKHRTWS